jgi:LDH2 family malate/lactate/ureidoglycolate dehydrogenase
MIDEIKSCRKRPGVDEILVPGERSSRTIAENKRNGIKLDAATMKELRGLASELDVPWLLGT